MLLFLFVTLCCINSFYFGYKIGTKPRKPKKVNMIEMLNESLQKHRKYFKEVEGYINCTTIKGSNI